MRYLLYFSWLFFGSVLAQQAHFPTLNPNYNICLSLVDRQHSYYFLTEIAATPAQRKIGMMYRSSLKEKQAMLFIFEQARPLSFWMKNVQMPLDMLFFDSSGKLQEIKPNVSPCYTGTCPTYPAKHNNNRYVLEIKGGVAAKYGLALGARLQQVEGGVDNCHD